MKTNMSSFMDANKFLKIGIGSLAIAAALYIVYQMVMPIVISYYAMNKADEITDIVNDSDKKIYLLPDEVHASILPPEATDLVETETVYIDINTGKGMLTVHTGIPKDSVLMILGQPSSSNFGDSYRETCGYEYPNHKGAYLVFSEGKLKSVWQY